MVISPCLFEKVKCSESEKRYLLEIAEELYNLAIYINKNGLMVIDSLLNGNKYFKVRNPQFVMLYDLLDKHIFFRHSLSMTVNGYDKEIINEFLANILNSFELRGRELYEIMIITEGVSLISSGILHTAIHDLLLSMLGERFLSIKLTNRFLNRDSLTAEEAKAFLNPKTLDISNISEINITSSILTFKGEKSSISIKRDINGFNYSYDNYLQPYLEDKENIFSDKPVDMLVIKNFIDALLEPAIDELNIETLGLNKAEISNNSANLIKKFNNIYQSQIIPDDKIVKVVEILNDFEYIKEAVSEYYSSNWFDDYPKVTIEIKLSDEKTITLQSNDQHLFMIPWFISSDNVGGSLKNYNIKISKSLAKLLPHGFVNKERLSGEGLIFEVIKSIRSRIV